MSTPRLFALLACFFVPSVWAGGFQLTPTVNTMPRSLAGNGVAGDELGDMFYNPAGLVPLRPWGSAPQGDAHRKGRRFGCEVGTLYLRIENEFSDGGSTLTGPGGVAPSTGPVDTSNDDAYIPTFFCAGQISEKWHFGFANAPTFGLKNNYDVNWIGRYHGLKSKLFIVNAAPTFAYQVTDQFIVGAGVSFEYADAELSRAIFIPGAPDGHARVDGDDFGYGYNLGVIWQPPALERGRIGVSFRSKIKHDLEGKGRFIIGPTISKIDAEASTTLPESVFLSLTTDLPGSLRNVSVAATARWTNWSRFDEVRIRFPGAGLDDDVTEEGWNDSWMVGGAITYHHSPALRFTLGGGFDDSPVPNVELRTVRVPDADKHFLGFGVIWEPPGQWFSTEVIYQRLFIASRSIRSSKDLLPGAPGTFVDTIVGDYASDEIDVFGLRFTFYLDKMLEKAKK